MKRKIIAVLMAVAMTVSLAACGSSPDSGSGSSSSESNESNEKDADDSKDSADGQDQARQLTAAKYIISVSASWLSMKHWMQRQKALKTP